MHFSVVVFPGSNCDSDTWHALDYLGHEVSYVWHGQEKLPATDCVVIPGGFSYGDYLRPGSIARFSPLMENLVEYANSGGLVLGICNGFQVLTEAGLLPGALLQNHNLQFRCQWQWLKTENNGTVFTGGLDGAMLRLPIAHGDGRFYLPTEQLRQLEQEDRVVFRYCDAEGNVSPDSNPNGAEGNVAGIINKDGNVLGMMPHPERAVETLLGGTDGARLFASLQRGWEGLR